MSVSNGQRDRTLKFFPSSEFDSTSKASKSSILRKKPQAEKLALQLKVTRSKMGRRNHRLLRAELLDLKGPIVNTVPEGGGGFQRRVYQTLPPPINYI